MIVWIVYIDLDQTYQKVYELYIVGTKKGYAYIVAGIVLFFMSSLGSANEGPSGEPAWIYVVPWWIAGSALIIFGARSVRKAKTS